MCGTLNVHACHMYCMYIYMHVHVLHVVSLLFNTLRLVLTLLCFPLVKEAVS